MHSYLPTAALVALALTLPPTLASALPPRSPTCGPASALLTFQGATPSSAFPICVPLNNQWENVGSSLSISYITYNHIAFSCAFQGAHQGQGAASPALTCEGGGASCDTLTVGPPQPITMVRCTSLSY